MAPILANVLPESLRFVLSGSLGSAIFWLLNEAIIAVNPYEFQPITVAFFLSYLISIWMQHALHATLVYGWGEIGYIKGLIATYGAYSFALIASVPINAGLVHTLSFTVFQAWLGTLILTGCFNYFIIGLVMKKKDKRASKKE
eukprot:m.85086 g.85086  ORF g.85086 m.85086 type:complete len:143 (+) comp12994_c0_seq1:245-673(+)